MPSLFDYLERSVTGPIMTQKDFQMKILIPNVRKIVNEFDIKYDSKNEAIEGTILTSSSLLEGTIKVSKKDGDYLFEIEMDATKGDEKYTITSDFNDALIDGYFYL